MDFSKIKAVTAGKTKTTGISPFSELEISKVYPNPNQPRKQFDDIEELASTIKEHGLLQPITVVKKDDGYMIVSGERRYKAHLFNEAKTIKAHIIDVSEDEIEELALIENIQRNDLTDFEIAKGIVKRWNSGKYEKKSDLAKKIGKSESYVSKAFSALKLDDDILEDIATNKKDISVSVMDEISRVKDKDVQKEVYQKYNAGEITRDDIKEYKEPIGLKTVYAGGFRFTARYSTIVNFSFLVARHNNTFLEEDKNYNCIVEKINKEQDFFQTKDELLFTLKANKKNLEDLEKLGSEWIKIANSLLKNKIYRFTITLSTFQEKPINEPKSEKEETNIALQKYEDAEKDLIDQAETFNENFPTGNLEATFKVGDLVQDKTEILEAKSFKENFPLEKSYNEELNDANKLENQFTQLIEEGYRSPHPKIKLNNAYEIIIYRLLLQKSSKEVDNKFNKINTWLNKDGGRIQNSSKGKLLLSDGCCTSLDNRYDEIIFDLLKENLELKKEPHNLKGNQTIQDNSILENDIKELLTKEISIININKISNIFKTDDGKSIILDIEQSIKYFKNCKQKEFKISFIFESARKIFIDEVLGKLDDYVLNEDEKILFNNKTEIIKIIEVCESGIYIEYDNSDSETISYSKAKELIKKSTQKSIPYTISSKTEKAYDFINKMPNRTQKNSNLILKVK
ncbi:ParB/RepB/Spo0J family partition protein [Aliarcobacter butzleri]|uniref:ParB/RepB/Spo0J family partition protein n=1 Tax=Aliarcobacter butzleri TaxID=28197 RepID=UPI00263DD675|nr:ParB/RepB/Spo0J family partition protein [Aliarcobacter butzleri]MDN5061337.1 ParB/RepB/Spo0J family partition protein [Aliarcobacter butzleri]